jgi:biotin carboxylase
MKDKVLILNGSHSEITLIDELKKMGKYVITTGNLPDSFVHKMADEYIQADYSDMKTVLNIAQEKQIDGIVSCANDFGIITASYVADFMGLKGHDPYETTVLLHQKDLFKEFAINNHMQVPFSRKYDSVEEALEQSGAMDYPVIIKPVDLTGGKGVSRAENPTEYEHAVRAAFERSRKKVIVVERYISGTYHSFSTFLVNKKVVAYYSDNEYSNVYRYFVDTSAGPADCIDDVKEILIRQAELVAEKLHLVNGVFHMQYVMDSNKIPYVIDITRRCSGDIYPEPVEHATGVPWSKWIVMSELGYPSEEFKERGVQSKLCGRHCIMADCEGRIRNVVIDESLKPYIYKTVQWWKPGMVIKNHQVDKAGILFYEFPTRDIMLDCVSRIKQLVKVEME